MLDIALEEVQIMLRGLRSVVHTSNRFLEFLHGSFEDFLWTHCGPQNSSQEGMILKSGVNKLFCLHLGAKVVHITVFTTGTRQTIHARWSEWEMDPS